VVTSKQYNSGLATQMSVDSVHSAACKWNGSAVTAEKDEKIGGVKGDGILGEVRASFIKEKTSRKLVNLI
jgi:hypothetical protein